MKLIAFYLPQFHEIPENNKWWGEGFTEWVNVKKAKPLFENHNQPRIPLNNNYYNLLDIQTLKWQAKLAKEYGVNAFCFYHYWFNGKLLLEKPMELLLKTKDIDISYCISWANEDWTNGWVSDDNKILIGQDFSKTDDWEDHFQYLLPFFKDPRYLKKDGKPVLIIYFPSTIKQLDKMIEYWRKRAMDSGLKGLYLMYQKAQYHFDKSKEKSCFDAGIAFQPGFQDLEQKSRIHQKFERLVFNTLLFMKKQLKLNVKRKKSKIKKISYDKAWENILQLQLNDTNIYPGAFVDWDNSPRKGNKGSVYIGANPNKFQFYFSQLLKSAKNANKDMLFMFAWNEWGESGYLEPDEKYGYGYLEAIRNALWENSIGIENQKNDK